MNEPSEADFRLAEKLASHQGTSVRRLAEAFRDVRAAAARAPEHPAVASALRASRARCERLQELWLDLVEKDDRTSPEEYPDMAMLTRDEFFGYLKLYAAEHDAQVEPLPSGLQHLLDALDNDATALHLAGAIRATIANAVMIERLRCEQVARHDPEIAAAIGLGVQPAAPLPAADVVRRVRDRMAEDFFLHPAEAVAEVTRYAVACRVLAVAAPRRTAEQFAHAVVHEYGPRWWNDYARRYPNSTASEQTKREAMALACVLGALSELELPWLAQLLDPTDDLLAAVQEVLTAGEILETPLQLRLAVRRVLRAAGEHLRAKP